MMEYIGGPKDGETEAKMRAVPQVIVCPAHTESRYRYTRTDGNWLFAEELPPLPPLPPKL